MDMKLEVLVVPVSDVDRAKAADRNYLLGLDNYGSLGGGQLQLTR